MDKAGLIFAKGTGKLLHSESENSVKTNSVLRVQMIKSFYHPKQLLGTKTIVYVIQKINVQLLDFFKGFFQN